MISTFHGLETARRALSSAQGALYTTGHNIANANTPGYSRQRVNLVPGEPFPNPSLNRPAIPGQLGTGVKIDSIQRYREEFLDLQYRAENSKYGYWQARTDALTKMEDIMNEPSESGIANNLDKFWTALQDLSVHPEDSGARSVVRQRGIALAETFNYVSDSLKMIQRDLQKKTEATMQQINSLIRQINNINLQIAKVEPHGYVPNDLYDRRDLLVDELSTYLNIKVERVNSGGAPSPVAEGLYTIKLIDENGREMGVTLVDGKRFETQELYIKYEELDGGEKGLIEKLYFGPPKTLESTPKDQLENVGGITAFEIDQFRSYGRLLAEVEAFGYYGKDELGNTVEKGVYPDMINKLDIMVYTFVQEFNRVHRQGWSLNDIKNGERAGHNFFEFDADLSNPPKGAASSIRVSDAILAELDNIAAASTVGGNVVEFVSANYGGSGNPFEYYGAHPIVDGEYTGIDDVQLTLVFNQSAIPNWSLRQTIDGVTTPVSITIINNTISYYGIKIKLPNMSSFTSGETVEWKLDIKAGFKSEAFSGDGSNALALANVKDTLLNFGGSTTNVHSFYQGVIGQMAVDTNEADRMTRNSDTLRQSVDEKRMSLSSVSLDEEFTNMIKFQHAYNAAARNITIIDEMLDRIINGMGRVGL